MAAPSDNLRQFQHSSTKRGRSSGKLHHNDFTVRNENTNLGARRPLRNSDESQHTSMINEYINSEVNS